MRRLQILAAIGAASALALGSAGPATAKRHCPKGKVLSHGKCIKKHATHHTQQQGAY